MFRIGYNTNGLAHHRLGDALFMLADMGYEAIALTPDVGQLDPFRLDQREVEAVRRQADDLGLSLAIETGARFLMDARRKHYPTLLEDDEVARSRRVDFLKRCIDLASSLGAEYVSMWAGAAPQSESGLTHAAGGGEAGTLRGLNGARIEEIWTRLRDGCLALLDHARRSEVGLVFEPEPGMFVETPAGYRELVQRLGADGADLGLCLDVGHLYCTRDLPPDRIIHEFANELRHVHLDDIAGGVHEHRMFGEGELDLSATLRALVEVGFSGMAAVELSRDSHRGAVAAEEALQHIRAAFTA